MTRTGPGGIQTRIQSLLQATATFTAVSVALGDFRVTNNGKPPWAILVPGGLEQDAGQAAGLYLPKVRTFIEIWRPYREDGYAALTTALVAALDCLNSYPTLNNLADVVFCHVTEIGDLLFLKPDVAGSLPQFAGFRLALETNLAWTYSGEGEF